MQVPVVMNVMSTVSTSIQKRIPIKIEIPFKLQLKALHKFIYIDKCMCLAYFSAM